MKILIIGNGYLGTRCANEWPDAVVSGKIINTVEEALAMLDEHRPDAVLNAAGVKGVPNVDWCETNQRTTVLGNTLLPIILAEACQQRGVYFLHMGSGCIFYGDSPHGNGWKEDDFGNPRPVYSRSKYAADLVLSTLPNVGIARIRLPIDSVPSACNLIDKLASYSKIVDVENSVTIIDDMVKVFRELLEKKAAGIFHVTNPGTVKHREIIDLYEKYVDTNLEKEWISEETLVNEGLAAKKRSNNFLQSTNLEKFGIRMRHVKEALEDTIKKYAEALKKNKSSGEKSDCDGVCKVC